MIAAPSQTRSLSELLEFNPVRSELVGYLKELKKDCGILSSEQVLVILGQWFHPLHYFPTFLAGLISITPDIETQTFISRILWQELGEGEPANAHEKIYIRTILDGGFDDGEVAGTLAFAATAELVEGYQHASTDYLAGLGFLYGTEVVDLPMVATIGELMRRCTGKRNLPWVNIHVAQEPHHVESSSEALNPRFSEDEQQRIVASAERLWRLWTNFFRSVRQVILPV
jgi:hypothetical protein